MTEGVMTSLQTKTGECESMTQTNRRSDLNFELHGKHYCYSQYTVTVNTNLIQDVLHVSIVKLSGQNFNEMIVCQVVTLNPTCNSVYIVVCMLL